MAFANIVRGVPIDADMEYVGGFFNLLNPYALLGGADHAAAVPHPRRDVHRAQDRRPDPRTRPRAWRSRLGLGAAVVAVAFLVWTQVDDRHRRPPRSPSCWPPLALRRPACVAVRAGREGWAFIGTFVAIALGVAGLFLALFPDVMPTSPGRRPAA